MDRRVRRLLGSHALASVALSLPWPWLLVLVWDRTHSSALLGLAAAARMLPYVVCSWWAGRIGDRHRRDLVVRVSVAARVVLLAGVPVAVLIDQLAVAIVLAAVAVAAATPAYPALAAAMPNAAGPESERATGALVTIEVSSFVVGPAIGALLLIAPAAIAATSLVTSVAALALLHGIRLDYDATSRARHTGLRATLRASTTVRRSIGLLSLVNLVNAAVGVTLLPMAHGAWTGGWSRETAYGVASGALGFGALAAPALTRCGARAAGRVRIGVLLVGVAVLAVAASPTAAWAVAPLLLAGAAAVHAESAATTLIQDAAPDDVLSSLFGLADASMVGAALVGALLAPSLEAAVGPPLLLVALAVTSGLSAGLLRGGVGQAVPTTTVAASSSSVSTVIVRPTADISPAVRSA